MPVATAQPAPGEAIDRIRARGALAVCLRHDIAPYGFVEGDGTAQGFEHDLAEDLTARLAWLIGAALELRKVPVRPADRIRALQEGRCDVLMATMTDTAERRRLVDIVTPHYYASGLGLLARDAAPFASWADIAGVSICTLQGAPWNPRLEELGAKLSRHASLAEAGEAVREDRCLGLAAEDIQLVALTRQPTIPGAGWTGFSLRLPPEDRQPWGLAVTAGESELARHLAGIVTLWHRDGVVVEAEKRWGLPPSPFAREAHGGGN